MPCVSPDGKPTASGMKTLKSIKAGAATPPEVAKATGQPMFKVRSGLRELVSAGFLEEVDGKYHLTSTGSNIF
jgi:DNA-binding IclR family transcriptional regulator